MGSKVELAYTWAIKYQPMHLADFLCHRDQAIRLQGVVCNGNFNSLIFEGPPGVGKRTMALAMLRTQFGPQRTKEEMRDFKLVKVHSRKVAEHPHVIKELIEEMEAVDNENGRAIIINEADCLCKEIQFQIKSFIEDCKGNCRIILCCNDISRLQHLSSLCPVIQLRPPSDEEIIEVLDFIAKQEGIKLPQQLGKKMAEKSKHCLQQAIRSFEATWRSGYPFKEDQEVLTGWAEELSSIAKSIVEEQTPKRLFIFRQKLQILLEHNLCPEFVFEVLVEELKRHLSGQIHLQLKSLYHEYNSRNGSGVCSGSRNRKCSNQNEASTVQMGMRISKFVIIEEFVAKFMSLYKCNGIAQDEHGRDVLLPFLSTEFQVGKSSVHQLMWPSNGHSIL